MREESLVMNKEFSSRLAWRSSERLLDAGFFVDLRAEVHEALFMRRAIERLVLGS
ncbi:hypothetical protein D9M71_834530 [compost metagenome]